MLPSAPLLYHHVVGRFTPGEEALPDELAGADACGNCSGEGSGAATAAAAAVRHGVASAMLRAADEADTAARLQAALAREARAAPESESDSDEDDSMAVAAQAASAGAGAASGSEDADEAAEPGLRRARVESFARLMRERFVDGREDAAAVDYQAVDSDTALDERWARLAAQDAEDAYFEAADE